MKACITVFRKLKMSLYCFNHPTNTISWIASIGIFGIQTQSFFHPYLVCHFVSASFHVLLHEEKLSSDNDFFWGGGILCYLTCFGKYFLLHDNLRYLLNPFKGSFNEIFILCHWFLSSTVLRKTLRGTTKNTLKLL